MLAAIPRMLSIPFSIVPQTIPASVAAMLANRLLKSQQLLSRLQDIEGAHICFAIDDMQLQFLFQVKHSKFVATDKLSWDTRISGTLAGFLSLATRKEDPDTLFFNRSLILEGKTETGLYIKNLLDAVDIGIDCQLQALTGRKPPVLLSRALAKGAAGIRSIVEH